MKTSFFIGPRHFPRLEVALAGIGIFLIGIFLYSCEKSLDLVSSNDKIRPRFSGVTVQQNMLKFDDLDAVDEFMDSIDSYRAKFHSLNDNSMLLSHVDPGVNEMEDEVGYLSLSSKYDSLEYIDDEFRSNARGGNGIFLGDPKMQVLLNRNHEVWIEDTIYKVVANYKYFKIVGADVDVLNSIRSDPEEPTVDTNTIIEYFNDNVPSIKPRNGCLAFLEFAAEPPPTGTDPTVYIKLKMSDLDGYISFCQAGTLIVDWGDGSQPSSYNHNNVVYHQYSVAPNSTETFTIEATFDLIFPSSCNSCDEGIYKATITYTVTNDFCVTTNQDNFILPAEIFIVNGNDWKVEGWGGMNPRFRFLNDPKVRAEIFLWKRNSNGNFKRKRPDIGSSIRIFKSTFNYEDCSEGEDTFDNLKFERDNKVCVKEEPQRNFSAQDELSEEPLVDFKVFISSSQTPNFIMLNKELFPD
jgi:hypothetical protein